MSVIKSLNETSEKALDVGEVYYKKTQEYYKLKVFKQLTLTLSTFCKIVMVGGLLLISLLFFTVSGTLALARALDNTALACLLIAFGILILAGLIYFLRSKIETLVIKKTAKNFFD